MFCLSSNLTQTVFVYLYLCIWMSDTWEHCFWGPCTISFSKIYHIMGLFRVFLLQSSAVLISGMGWMDGSLCGVILWAPLCGANKFGQGLIPSRAKLHQNIITDWGSTHKIRVGGQADYWILLEPTASKLMFRQDWWTSCNRLHLLIWAKETDFFCHLG